MNEEKFDYEIVSWEKLQDFVKNLADKIKESNYDPNIIIGISKGGWAISRLLCDCIDGKDIISLDVKRLESYGQGNLGSLNINLLGKKVLIVDDIIDRKIVNKTIEYIKPLRPDEIKFLALFYIKGKIKPDYCAEEISHKLVIFPWNFIDSIRKIIYKNRDGFRGMSAKRIKSRLKQSFNIDIVEEEAIEETLKDLEFRNNKSWA